MKEEEEKEENEEEEEGNQHGPLSTLPWCSVCKEISLSLYRQIRVVVLCVQWDQYEPLSTDPWCSTVCAMGSV